MSNTAFKEAALNMVWFVQNAFNIYCGKREVLNVNGLPAATKEQLQ